MIILSLVLYLGKNEVTDWYSILPINVQVAALLSFT
ncbi:MAG: hypothetical protein ACI9F1_002627, partial [Colwellia sp.]